ncbi:MAG: DUF4293 domain-containing protein [Prevotellaceae bacterium]|jgi:hypothetical protein|nr:DUF4293 domain-containing protein [Prevotellaceae bacterium]
MIQRIQTIYLLLAALLLSSMLFLPVVTLGGDGDILLVNGFGSIIRYVDGSKETLSTPVTVPCLLIATALLLFVTLWLYRNRRLQIRLTLLSTGLTLCYGILIGCYAWMVTGDYSLLQPTIGIGAAALPLTVLCECLAVFNIRKDEKLVRSTDRLR